MEESEIFLVIILLVQKQLISIRYLILIFIVVISVLTKGFLSTTLFNKLVCFRFFFVMDDKTYIRLVKIGYRNYSVSPRWYSTPLRVVEYHRLDWIILDIRFYLVEYLFNIFMTDLERSTIPKCSNWLVLFLLYRVCFPISRIIDRSLESYLLIAKIIDRSLDSDLLLLKINDRSWESYLFLSKIIDRSLDSYLLLLK